MSSLAAGSVGRRSCSSSSCFDGNRLGSWYSRLNNVDDSFRASRRYVLKNVNGEISVGYITQRKFVTRRIMRAMCLCFLVHPTGSVLEQSVRDDNSRD